MLHRLTFVFGILLQIQNALAQIGHFIEERAVNNASVILDSGTIVGIVNNDVETFEGIPYAEPPVGPLRLRPPQRLTENLGVFDATEPAPSCPQFVISNESENFLIDILGDISAIPLVQKATGQTEDCLTITVTRPEGTTENAQLPVLYWIYGGGFEVTRPSYSCP
jgi:carboxylesterase type B